MTHLLVLVLFPHDVFSLSPWGFLHWGFDGQMKKARDVFQELELSTCKSGIQTLLIVEAALNISLIFLGCVSQPHGICCTEVSVKWAINWYTKTFPCSFETIQNKIWDNSNFKKILQNSACSWIDLHPKYIELET